MAKDTGLWELSLGKKENLGKKDWSKPVTAVRIRPGLFYFKMMLSYVPLDKSWTIRMGFLDITRGYGSKDILHFLESQKDLGEDIKALARVASIWNTKEPLDVGESGTIYRLVRFYIWKEKIDREIITRGTLTKRVKEMKAGPEIVTWHLKQLLTLEHGTTQWATAAILFGNSETLPEVPFYLQKTYDSLAHWNSQRKKGKVWIPQKDVTLSTQVKEYISYLKTGKISIVSHRLGDCDLYCFLRAFNRITRKEGEVIWPQLKSHESDRFLEMERTLEELYSGNIIHSRDHRVVQAEAMLLQSRDKSKGAKELKKYFSNPDCVNKTWPQFWEFMDYCKDISKS